MKIYTVSSLDDHLKFGTNHCVIGSFTTRDRALDECADYIMKRLRVRNDLAFCMANDANHTGMKEFFSGTDGRSDDWRVKRGKSEALREFLQAVLKRNGCYYVYLDAGAGWFSFHFDVDENDVVGGLWQTVTWGDGNSDDPEFTNQWPEAFTSQETAIETFVGYVKDLYRSHCMKWSDKFLRDVRESLVNGGKVQVKLNDGSSVNCIMYSGDVKNIKE